MAVPADHEDRCQFEVDAMQSMLKARQSGLPSDNPQSSSYQDLDRLRTVLTWSFGISVVSTVIAIGVGSEIDPAARGDSSLDSVLMVLLIVMCFSGLGFLLSKLFSMNYLLRKHK